MENNALLACPAIVFCASANKPPVVNTIPKNTNLLTISNSIPCYENNLSPLIFSENHSLCLMYLLSIATYSTH